MKINGFDFGIHDTNRRSFIKSSGLVLAALGSAGPLQALAQAGNTLT
ncbi:MAG: twin-arginine translocation signal domain-containing protein, partial [Proteobacteria bacterium]|nr:twin-arginine translocation signal domain-containing protein [Pseudomonadota bacterium]